MWSEVPAMVNAASPMSPPPPPPCGQQAGEGGQAPCPHPCPCSLSQQKCSVAGSGLKPFILQLQCERPPGLQFTLEGIGPPLPLLTIELGRGEKRRTGGGVPGGQWREGNSHRTGDRDCLLPTECSPPQWPSSSSPETGLEGAPPMHSLHGCRWDKGAAVTSTRTLLPFALTLEARAPTTTTLGF